MKKTRFMGLLLAVLMMAMTVLSGCSKEEVAPPDQVATALYQLIIKDDAVPMKELFGYASEEDVRKEFFGDNFASDITAELQTELTAMGLEMDEEEVGDLYTSMMASLARLEFSAEVTSEDKETAIVTAKIGYYDEADLMAGATKAAEDALAEFGEENLLNEDGYTEFMRLYFSKYIESWDSLTPAEGTKEITVDFEKVKADINGKTKTVWMPMNAEQFGADLGAAAMGGM